MANLFWKTIDGTKSLLATPFKNEEEFEKIIHENRDILEDIFLIKRQIRGGNKTTIPDIVGIDSEGNVCIVEIKNIVVDASIIPQVLQYAFWAETNPDSIKSLWFECNNKPDNLNINWDDFQVRIIVIAPKILLSTLDIVDKVNYQIDLIEINKWIDNDNQMLLVKKLESEESRNRIRPVEGLKVYDREFYRSEYNKISVEYFFNYIKDVEIFIQKKGWDLETKYNRQYCGFKAGHFIAFGIKWIGSKTIAFFFKMHEKEAKALNPHMTKYESLWKEAVYYIEPQKTNVEEFISLFEAAYKRLTGEY